MHFHDCIFHYELHIFALGRQLTAEAQEAQLSSLRALTALSMLAPEVCLGYEPYISYFSLQAECSISLQLSMRASCAS